MALRVLIDTNILLDYLVCRKPFDADARMIVKACSEKKDLWLYCSAFHTKYVLYSEKVIQCKRKKVAFAGYV